ncbi:MAG: hypothetical protein JW841_00770 [Deltaproteobacteria bacterium]|nr:hypothetical protein [Deltaproteobacteria bacterium]
MSSERSRPRSRATSTSSLGGLPSALFFLLRTSELIFYSTLLRFIDRITRLPRGTMIPEAMRLYCENIALKAQLDALQWHMARLGRPAQRVSISTRAAQVFAYLLTRGNEFFLRYSLSTSIRTIRRWSNRLLHLRLHTASISVLRVAKYLLIRPNLV